MIHGHDAATAAAAEHYTDREADYDFHRTSPDVPVRSRALHLLDQMAQHERILLLGLLRPEAKVRANGRRTRGALCRCAVWAVAVPGAGGKSPPCVAEGAV